MKIRESKQVDISQSDLQEYSPRALNLSFTKMVDDAKFGLPSGNDKVLNDKKTVQKIVKTLMVIREKTAEELIQTKKSQQFGGCEKCRIDEWSWKSSSVKNFLSDISQKSCVWVLRAGDSRLFASINKNSLYIHCIEYKLGDCV